LQKIPFSHSLYRSSWRSTGALWNAVGSLLRNAAADAAAAAAAVAAAAVAAVEVEVVEVEEAG